MARRPRPHVALMVETSGIFGRRILDGIARYLRTHGGSWSVFLEQRALDTVPPRWLESWRGDGIISRIGTPGFEAAILSAGLAAVDLTHRRAPFGLPRIVSDDAAIGRLAAEHLIGRGYRSLAFCGYTDLLWSTGRRDGFLAHAPGGVRVGRVFESPGGPDAGPWEKDQKAIARWLKSLPKPVGVMACNDMRGLNVIDAGRRAGLDLPAELAVIGVDDDPLMCELCDPPLSSVVPNPERIGYEAAALLDRLMDGRTEGVPKEQLVPPLGVATRLSTDALMIDDPRIAAAVRFIRQNACRGITVRDVLEHVPLSRTALERRFRRDLGRSPQAEIRGVQLRRAKELLTQTDFKMDRIAELTGFEHPEYFNVVFKREVGRTPGRFRREARAAAPR